MWHHSFTWLLWTGGGWSNHLVAWKLLGLLVPYVLGPMIKKEYVWMCMLHIHLFWYTGIDVEHCVLFSLKNLLLQEFKGWHIFFFLKRKCQRTSNPFSLPYICMCRLYICVYVIYMHAVTQLCIILRGDINRFDMEKQRSLVIQCSHKLTESYTLILSLFALSVEINKNPYQWFWSIIQRKCFFCLTPHCI